MALLALLLGLELPSGNGTLPDSASCVSAGIRRRNWERYFLKPLERGCTSLTG